MFCTQCGAELRDGVKFCPNCGTQVDAQNQEATEPKEVNSTVEKPVEAGGNQIKSKSPKKWVLIVVVALWVAAILFAIYKLLSMTGTIDKLFNTNNNTNTENVVNTTNNANNTNNTNNTNNINNSNNANNTNNTNNTNNAPNQSDLEAEAREFFENTIGHNYCASILTLDSVDPFAELGIINDIYNHAVETGYLNASKIELQNIEDYGETKYFATKEWQYMEKNLDWPKGACSLSSCSESEMQAMLDFLYGKDKVLIFDMFNDDCIVGSNGRFAVKLPHRGFDSSIARLAIKSIKVDGNIIAMDIYGISVYFDFYGGDEAQVYDLFGDLIETLKAVPEEYEKKLELLKSYDMSKAVNTRTIKLYKDDTGIHFYTEEDPFIGYAKVGVVDLNVRSGPGSDKKAKGVARMGKTYRVYETKEAGGYKWLRIGTDEWIANLGGNTVSYREK